MTKMVNLWFPKATSVRTASLQVRLPTFEHYSMRTLRHITKLVSLSLSAAVLLFAWPRAAAADPPGYYPLIVRGGPGLTPAFASNTFTLQFRKSPVAAGDPRTYMRMPVGSAAWVDRPVNKAEPFVLKHARTKNSPGPSRRSCATKSDSGNLYAEIPMLVISRSFAQRRHLRASRLTDRLRSKALRFDSALRHLRALTAGVFKNSHSQRERLARVLIALRSTARSLVLAEAAWPGRRAFIQL